MDLKDFISQTLVQIANGISEANSQLSESDAVINPRNVSVSSTEYGNVYGTVKKDHESSFTHVQKVDFDVSVTATKETETKGGIKIGIGTIGLGSEGKSGKENQASNRIKFSIPMILPHE